MKKLLYLLLIVLLSIFMKSISSNHLGSFNHVRETFKGRIKYDTIYYQNEKYTIKNVSVRDGTYVLISRTKEIIVSEKFIKNICE